MAQQQITQRIHVRLAIIVLRGRALSTSSLVWRDTIILRLAATTSLTACPAQLASTVKVGIIQSRSRGYKTFSCSTQLSTKFQLLKKLKYPQMKKFLALSLFDVLFIMLINVKMPTIVGILILMSRERSGSVVECLTRDRGAVGSSLTGVTVLWSLSKTHFS